MPHGCLQSAELLAGVALGVVDSEVHLRPHSPTAGNPGTGKSTVAKCMASVLHKLGLLTTDHLEITSGLDLTGQYVGQTKEKASGVGQMWAHSQAASAFDSSYGARRWQRLWRRLGEAYCSLTKHMPCLVVHLARRPSTSSWACSQVETSTAQLYCISLNQVVSVCYPFMIRERVRGRKDDRDPGGIPRRHAYDDGS
jgi:hypothetical protein